MLVFAGRKKAHCSHVRSRIHSLSLSLPQLWDVEEEMTNLPVMGIVEPFFMEDPEIKMEEIHLENGRNNKQVWPPLLLKGRESS